MTWRLLLLVDLPSPAESSANVERLGPDVSPRFEELDTAQTSSCEKRARGVLRCLDVLAARPEDGPNAEVMKKLTSVGRFGKVEEIAAAVAFLAGPEAAFINGENLTVDGGWNA